MTGRAAGEDSARAARGRGRTAALHLVQRTRPSFRVSTGVKSLPQVGHERERGLAGSGGGAGGTSGGADSGLSRSGSLALALGCSWVLARGCSCVRGRG